MSVAEATALMSRCPDAWARAPRVATGEQGNHERLYLPPASLQGALVAVVCRDIRPVPLSDAQRLTHLPATPLMGLGCYQGFTPGVVQDGQFHALAARVVVSGTMSTPTVAWAPTGGRGVMVFFTLDVARSLFGLQPQLLHDRVAAAEEVLGPSWSPLLAALANAQDDESTLRALEEHLAPRWRALPGNASAFTSLRRIGRHWLDRLAWQAMQWGRTQGPRQVERRIKALSGRSLRDWRSLVRTEAIFFAARERYEAGLPFDWAGMAQEQGFADQAHLGRAVKRITGFSPTEFARRYAEDESFWLYRLWV